MVKLDQFRETYLAECAELLTEMEDKLVSLTPENADNEILNAIFRCAHSIKGGAGAFGFERVAAFTHISESLLDALRSEKVTVSEEAISALLRAADVTSALLKSESTDTPLPEDYEKELLGELAKLAGQEEPKAAKKEKVKQEPSGKAKWKIRFIPHENIFMSGNDPLLIIRELSGLGEMTVNADTSRIPLLASFNPEHCYLAWDIALTTEKSEDAIREVFMFVEDSCDLKIEKVEDEAKKEAPKEKAPAKTEATEKPEGKQEAISVASIRVDLAKIDRLVNMVGELVITQAMLYAQSKDLPVDKFPHLLRGVDELAQHTRELQEAVMAVRMQPVKSIFSRMPRIVRDIAQQLGKEIVLVMSGEQTEVDKTIIEQLSDPLTHMIRNAADHGIEMPDIRAAAGKSKKGTIQLSAFHQGGNIIIEVGEDGAGLNREKILAKAKENGLIAPDANLSDEQVEQLIFLPGFSTAATVSNISGRGVGMDVVKRNIAAMGGSVHVKSEFGKGSKFTVLLPLTLAILDGMIVRVGAEYYIIPITSIIETMRPVAGTVKSVPNGQDVLNVRGEFIQIVYLHELFGIPNAERDPAKALVVLVESSGSKLGIVVDELAGQQQVVIKSLEANADRVEGISGATILGDGKVSLILDIAGIGRVMAQSANQQYSHNIMEQKEAANG